VFDDVALLELQVAVLLILTFALLLKIHLRFRDSFLRFHIMANIITGHGTNIYSLETILNCLMGYISVLSMHSNSKLHVAFFA